MLMASQNHTSTAEAALSANAKVTRKPRSKRHHSEAPPTRVETAKRTRTDETGGSLVWRISRDASNGAWRFSFRPAVAADTTATATALESRSPVSKNSTAAQDGEDRVDDKKRPERRLPAPRLREMGVNPDGGLVRPLRKTITCSDVKRNQNRLLLPKDTLDGPLFEGMMTPAERAQAAERNGLAVKVLDRLLVREYDLVLKFVPSIRTYRIMGRNYSRLVAESKFRVGRFLDLWLFRVPTTGSATTDGGLRMAVVVEDDGDEEDEKAEAEEIQLRPQGGEGEETKAPLPQSELRPNGCTEAEEEAILGLLSLQYAPPPPLTEQH